MRPSANARTTRSVDRSTTASNLAPMIGAPRTVGHRRELFEASENEPGCPSVSGQGATRHRIAGFFIQWWGGCRVALEWTLP